MTSLKTFTITWAEFVSLAFDLLFLVESHLPLCRWLGPYEADDSTCAIARLYRSKFEGKLSALLISLCANLRILEDRGFIQGELVGETKGNDPSTSRVFQNDVGSIKFDEGEWQNLTTLRDLLNTIMHSDRIEFAVSILENVGGTGRSVMGFDDIVVVSAPRNPSGKGRKTVKLSLRQFGRYLFDIVEQMQPAASSGASE